MGAVDKLKTPQLPWINKATVEQTDNKEQVGVKKEEQIPEDAEIERIQLITKFEELDIHQIRSLGQCVTNKDYFNILKTKDRLFWDVSYYGTIKIAQFLGGYELVGMPMSEHTKDRFSYIVLSKHTESGVGNYGSGDCAKSEPYAARTALSIATRNAYKPLLPLDFIEEKFAEWYEDHLEKFESNLPIKNFQEYLKEK